MKMISRYYHTIRYLKSVQIFYRIFYFFRKLIRKLTNHKYNFYRAPSSTQFFSFSTAIEPLNAYWEPSGNTFIFLNCAVNFGDTIDWKIDKYGKLWTYNLYYFEYLLGSNISKEDGTRIIIDFIYKLNDTAHALEPYPTSLRIISWIRFLSLHKIEDDSINASLYAQAYILLDNIEYHLLGNHLLENGFAIFFASCYFGDPKLYKIADKILNDELKEQVLSDGAHFELSPMYHQVLLYRILTCIELAYSNTSFVKDDLIENLKNVAGKMLSWLNKISFTDGSIPLFNDAAFHIAPDTIQLNEYASKLKIEEVSHNFSDSGYRKFENIRFQLIVDVGHPGPDYIPGHAHSDIFNFELYFDNKPLIVDTGTSTYEKNIRRDLERSTSSHNTVTINDRNQSDVWGGFRVAKRACPILLNDSKNNLEANHDGYLDIGAIHNRAFVTNESSVQIDDIIIITDRHNSSEYHNKAFLHFHPSVTINKVEDDYLLLSSEKIKISFENHHAFEIVEYEYAPQFNKLITAQKIVIYFKNSLSTTIQIMD